MGTLSKDSPCNSTQPEVAYQTCLFSMNSVLQLCTFAKQQEVKMATSLLAMTPFSIIDNHALIYMLSSARNIILIKHE